MLEIAGIELLPAWPVFLGFVAAGLALNIVPGADMTFIIASAVAAAAATALSQRSASAPAPWSISSRR